jgi:peptide deformylase
MIVKVPNPVLTNPSKPVTKIDKKILGIVSVMKQTLIKTENPKGVGLAAPQIGIPLRIFITRPTENTPIGVFINPEIIWKSQDLAEIERPADKSKPTKRRDKKLEGCLSIPEVWGYLKRARKLRLRFTDLDGKIYEEDFEGFMATIIQHETDHLNGILFTHRVLEQQEKLYRIEEDEEGKEKLVEIEI